MRCTLKALLTMPIVLTACGGGSGDVTSPLVQDSAGVRIVTHVELDSLQSVLVGAPLYRFGDDAEEYAFVRAMGGTLREDGVAVIADYGTGEVLVLDTHGGLMWRAGGLGEGPGEFASLGTVGWAGDTVVAHDRSARRVTHLLDGETTGTFTLPEELGGTHPLWIQGPRLWAVPTGYLPITPDPWVRHSMVRYAMGSPPPDTVLTYDVARGFPDMAALQAADLFRGYGTIAVRGTRIVYGRNDRSEIEVRGSDGTLEQLWRWPDPRTQLTEDFWERYTDHRLTTAGDRSPAEVREAVADVRSRAGSDLPAFSALRVDAAGRIWVRAYDPTTAVPTSHQLFGPEGEWLGTVRLPERTEILDIGEEWLLAIQRDELDVQSIVLLPLLPTAR